MAWFSFLSNQVFFKVRKKIPDLRGNYKEYLKNADLFQRQNYFSKILAGSMAEKRLRVALFYAWILDQIPFVTKKSFIKALDLGSKDFAYAPALCRFLNSSSDSFELKGIEADPYIFYADLFRRGQAANYTVDICKKEWPSAKITYSQGNWLSNSEFSIDLIFCFFPFLFDDLHLDFKLPKNYFSPREFYQKIFSSSERAIFFHQGDLEREESIRLISEFSNIKIIHSQRFQQNPWLKRKYPVHVLVCEKN